jgi:hypothetical protein
MGSVCSSCRKTIVWAVTTKTGRAIPLDPTPGPEGNVTIVGRSPRDCPLVLVLSPEELALAREHGVPRLYVSHFATCPDAAKWRRKPPVRGVRSERSSA